MESKKSLGQNFFINKNLGKQITDIVLKNNPDILVEIGPGTGSFTQNFFRNNIDLILVEKDDSLANDISLKLPKAKVINKDFLEWEYDELKDINQKNIIFFGSLPYNVSKPIIRKIITSEYFKNSAYFIIQKEVAEKYIAREPNNSLLSVQTQLYALSKRLFNISPDSFRPKPKVHSSLISFSPINNSFDFDVNSFNKFLQICFKQPRKTLENNLKPVLKKEKHDIESDEKLFSLLSKRPQHISLDEYIYLFNNLPHLLI